MDRSFWVVPATSVKYLNKHTALDLIRFTPGGISRIELARLLNLTRAAMTSIVNDLLAARLVREVQAQRPTGRKPIVLEINPHRGYVAGIDIGSSHLTILLADASAQVLGEWEEALDISRGAQSCLDQADAALRQVLNRADLLFADLAAVGVGVPGPVVTNTGRVSAPPNMPGWDGFPIQDYLAERWRCQITLNNDAELGALGEWAYGAGRGERNLVYIKVGSGVGAGLLVNGQIYRGSTGSAGEIGHVTIDEGGELCSCGNRGCLEALAGGKAIARKAISGIRAGQRTRLTEIVPVESITWQDVLAAAQRGDLLSQQIVSEAGAHVGTAVASLVNLFNPGLVVIGGGVSRIGDFFLEPIRQAVQHRSLRAASQHVRITTALLGRRSSGVGAVVQAISQFLHQNAEGDPQRR